MSQHILDDYIMSNTLEMQVERVAIQVPPKMVTNSSTWKVLRYNKRNVRIKQRHATVKRMHCNNAGSANSSVNDSGAS